ncbi:hypothetical protein LSCM1_00916 [Leishmania martiniquensis]|uniref:Calmodulin n=1 Tax=Leishmania martiniquensis TaxID=1580590 RepID=A0A836GJQ2_9TRYP|nr:hypothetical protein LSCM1_00916 [Leishmania martiniquensis]
MAPVDVEKVNSVFRLFAVDAVDAHAGDAAAHAEVHESYIPVCFLAAAAREVGYYPTPSAIHQFTETVPGTASGAVTFAAFLEFCEGVAHTSHPGRSAIYKMIDELDPRGSGLISRHELFLVLASGSVNITESEIDAAMALLDPANRGYISLNDLAAVLIDSSECQWPASRSRAQVGRQQQHESSVAHAMASEKQQRCDKERRFHSRQTAAQPEDRKRYPKLRRGFLKKRGYKTLPSPPPAMTAVEWVPAQTQEQRWSSATVCACGSSCRRTECYSASERVYLPHGSLYSRQETFERTQTAMTVDVDVQPSAHQHTPTVRRRRFANSSSPAASSLTVQTPLRPLCSAASAAAAEEAPSHEKVEKNGERHPHHSNRADADSSARHVRSPERELEQLGNYRGLGRGACDDRSSANEAAPAMTFIKPSRKDSGSRCCIML